MISIGLVFSFLFRSGLVLLAFPIVLVFVSAKAYCYSEIKNEKRDVSSQYCPSFLLLSFMQDSAGDVPC